MSTTQPRYILIDATRAVWPGVRAYRATGRQGYRTADEAHARAITVMTDYAARHGAQGGPDVRVEVAR